jgi:hypothetical protein
MKGRDDNQSPPDPKTSGASETTGGALPPRAPFEPPVADQQVVALLKGLHTSNTPVPIEVSSSDGERSASFTRGPREIPRGVKTPPSEPPVVVQSPQDPSPPVEDASQGRPEDRVATTFRIRPARSSWRGPLWAAALLVGVLVAAAAVRFFVSESAVPDSASAPDPRHATAPAVPSAQPAPPPTSTAQQPAPTASEAPAAPDPARASPTRATPSTSVNPAKSPPSRRKEDEPERVL